jgi:hypothetical protein
MLGLTATQNRLPMQERLYCLCNYHALWHSAVLYRVTPRRQKTRNAVNPSGKSWPPPQDACPATGRHALLSSPTCLTLSLASCSAPTKGTFSCSCVFTSVFFREALAVLHCLQASHATSSPPCSPRTDRG